MASSKKNVKLVLSLREEPFFRPMSEAVQARVENLVYHRRYEPRQIVFFPDDACDYVYWVREGRVKITRVSGGGRELTFRHVFPGDILGEDCLVDKKKRDAYAEAMMDTTLCLMRANDFRRLLRDENELSMMVAHRLCERVQEVEQVLMEVAFKPVQSRVACGLIRLYRSAPKSENGVLRITHQEIANLIGATRETTTGVLHELCKKGILQIANRRVIVLDPVALEHVARSS